MISVSEAVAITNQHLLPKSTVNIPLKKATGRILAENIYTPDPLPPFDRVMMDGIAIRYEDYNMGYRAFKVAGVQAAGMPPLTIDTKETCCEIMTGAVMALGADTVIPYEHIEIKNGVATLKGNPVTAGQNIHRKGTDRQTDELIIKAGIKIGSSEVGILATLGKAKVTVAKLPKTAVISTGNELVDIDQKPLPHQIRKSNVYAISSALIDMGIKADLFHFPDNSDELDAQVSKITQSYDLVISSGGISKGKFDFVPGALKNAGIETHFHGVNQQPGKPFWFGTGDCCIVFAFPGNPVSTMVCFFRYLKPWLNKSLGLEAAMQEVLLAQEYHYQKPKTFFLQVALKNVKGSLMAHPVKGKGSGDLANMANISGIVELAPGKDTFEANSILPYFPFK